jgi:hypothetical protein
MASGTQAGAPLITETRARHNSDLSEKSGPFRQLGC